MTKEIKINPAYIPLITDTTECLFIYGGSGCFYEEQLVSTDKGCKRIVDIKNGDKVLSYNHEKKENEYREVKNTFRYESLKDRLINIKMKDGSIIKVTENHEFFYGGSYLKIKDVLLYLHDGNMEKNT